MRFLRIIFTIGYLFGGGMFLHSFTELMLRNAWFDLFEIQKITPKTINFVPAEKKSTEVRYEFEYKNESYVGKRKVINRIIKERLPKNEDEIEVSFNTRFPKVNYLDQLGLKTRSANMGLIISGFFLFFLLLIDFFGNKEKWLGIYGFANKTKANKS